MGSEVSGQFSIAAVSATDFPSQVAAASHQRLVLLEVGAAWCGPCRVLEPVLHQVATAEGERLSVLKLDVEAEPALAAQLEVRALPAMIFFRRGEAVDRLVGLHSAAAIQARVAALRSSSD
jgi:thioredoxin 1